MKFKQRGDRKQPMSFSTALGGLAFMELSGLILTAVFLIGYLLVCACFSYTAHMDSGTMEERLILVAVMFIQAFASIAVWFLLLYFLCLFGAVLVGQCLCLYLLMRQETRFRIAGIWALSMALPLVILIVQFYLLGPVVFGGIIEDISLEVFYCWVAGLSVVFCALRLGYLWHVSVALESSPGQKNALCGQRLRLLSTSLLAGGAVLAALLPWVWGTGDNVGLFCAVALAAGALALAPGVLLIRWLWRLFKELRNMKKDTGESASIKDRAK